MAPTRPPSSACGDLIRVLANAIHSGIAGAAKQERREDEGDDLFHMVNRSRHKLSHGSGPGGPSRYCVVKVLSVPYLVPAALLATIRK